LPILALVVVACLGYAIYLLLRAHEADVAVRRANAMLQEARGPSFEGTAQLLANCCAECERVLAGHPRHVLAWHVWGAALWCLGRSSPPDKADLVFAEAEDKFSHALEIWPDNVKLTLDLCWVLWDRADLHPGNGGLRHLMRICDESQRVLARKPGEPRLLNFWASALCCIGTRTSPGEAEGIFASAENRFKEVLAITPNDHDAMSSLANVLCRRARLHQGDVARAMVVEAGEWLDKALELKPGDPRALSMWAWVLYARTKVMPCEETSRMLADAAQRFAAAGSENAGFMRQALGVLLWARSRCAHGPEIRRLLADAKAELLEAELHDSESAAYNLACVCAQLGEAAACRKWLEKSREPGILVSCEQMASEEELAAVRDCDWFRKLVGD